MIPRSVVAAGEGPTTGAALARACDEGRTARIIDGRALADGIVRETRAKVDEARASSDVAPGLAVILVGGDPASHIDVEAKLRKAREAGIETFEYRFDDIDEVGRPTLRVACGATGRPFDAADHRVAKIRAS